MIPRFHWPASQGPLAPNRQAALPPAAAHHAVRVLRLDVGDEIALFDGAGGEYPARISSCGRDVVVAVGDRRDVEREAPLAVTLAQALPAGDKMDWVLQKAVELGVAGIQPLSARRSVVRLDEERARRRSLHWQQVVEAACEQCGRNRLPLLAPLLTLAQFLELPAAPAQTRLLLSPRAEQRLSRLQAPRGEVVLLVGPEGGLDDGEERAAQACGFTAVALGPRVLRAETAGLAALAAIMALWGDY